MIEPTRKIRALAREAEAHDQEAIAEMEAAQQPDSECGTLITPREASRIRTRVLRSAVLDNEAATLAEPREPTSA